MNFKTIGCVELNSIAVGFLVADEMIKSASVDLLMARTACPGRYLIMICGDTGSVETSVQTGMEIGKEMVVDHFVIANVHPSILPALNSTSPIQEINAIGVIETYSTASCILAADAAAKSGIVDIIEIRSAAGLAGKAFVTMTGDVGSVETSVTAAIEHIKKSAQVVSHVVIPSPSQDLKQKLF